MTTGDPLWHDIPLSMTELERFRVAALHNQRASLVGTHVLRRKGASLDFGEFTPYMLGDDMRYIDWRASARNVSRQYGGSGSTFHLLTRRFESEEKFKIVISIDMRESMTLPIHLPKLQIAAWLAEVLAWLGLQSDDKVILHNLFGAAGNSRSVVLAPQATWHEIWQALQRQWERSWSHWGQSERLNLSDLERHLPPTAVWVIISDGYFDGMAANELAKRIRQARAGMRWVIPVDLDSWEYERTLLTPPTNKARAFDIDGPGIKQPKVEIDKGDLSNITERIANHKRYFRKQAGLPEASDRRNELHWEWAPASEREQRDPKFALTQPQNIESARTFFRHWFRSSPVLTRLFMKERV